jgi:transketolase
VIVASGMMLAPSIRVMDVARDNGVDVGLVYVPVIKPIDGETILEVIRDAMGVVTAENHSVIGGLGSAIAEVMAEEGLGVPLRRMGVQDEYATAGSRPYLFKKFGLSSQRIAEAVWELSGALSSVPEFPEITEERPGVHEPV